MTQHWKIEGKKFLVTGAASGLGASYVESFLKEGAKKIAILDVAEATGKATTTKLNSAYQDRVIFVKCDISNEESIVSAFQTILDDFGSIDVIINNAGVMNDSPNMWRKATEVNWQGIVSIALKGLNYMSKDNGGVGGTIVNIASVAALYIQHYSPIYGGSKAAVLYFGQSLAKGTSYAAKGVRILTLCLGATDTAMLRDTSTRIYDEAIGKELDETLEMMQIQKVESAAAACVEMFKVGDHGSVWVATDNRPVKDITKVVQKAFEDMENSWNY